MKRITFTKFKLVGIAIISASLLSLSTSITFGEVPDITGWHSGDGHIHTSTYSWDALL